MTARLVTSAAEIGRARWNGFANPRGAAEPHPFTTYEFFSALEESGSATAKTGWQPAHLLLDAEPPPGASAPDGGGGRSDRGEAERVRGATKPIERPEGASGLLPMYLKNHSYGEYVFDHAWAEALERAGGDYYPKLQASVPFTPVTGRRLLGDAPLLLATAKAAVKQICASSLHITFLTREEWLAAGDAGYALRTGQQFHWQNRGYKSFDEFLGELSSAKRKNLRKERASVREAGVEFDWLTGGDITEAHWDQFFDFYMDTGGRKWGTPYLTREFFSRLGEGLGRQTLLVMAKRDGKYIAGALNLFGEGVLFGRNWGATEYIPFLHFETCYYQAIDFAIARRLERVEAGAQGEHKLLRGYLPVPTYSAHVIVHKGLARAVDDFLLQERQAVAENIAELAKASPFRKDG